MLTPDTLLGRTEGILHAAVGPDRVLMMSVAAGKYFGLNPTAARIWSLLEQPLSAAALRDALCAEYEVAPAQCEAELLRFLEELMANGLIHALAA